MRSLDIFKFQGRALAEARVEPLLADLITKKFAENMYPVNVSRRSWARKNVMLFYSTASTQIELSRRGDKR